MHPINNYLNAKLLRESLSTPRISGLILADWAVLWATFTVLKIVHIKV